MDRSTNPRATDPVCTSKLPSSNHDPAHSAPMRTLPRSNSIARDYSNEQYVTDVTIDWLYTPHSLIALGICVVFLVSCAFDRHQYDPQTALMRGLGSASFVFIVFGVLVFPSGPFTRPHPALWRAVFAVSVLYLFGLVVLLFQDVDTARWAMTFFDSTLNVKPVERPYAEDCRINFDTLYAAIFDRFVLAHFFGWIAKSMVMRNRLVCWVSSITWELVEISFTHLLPNFAECWWDQILLDVLICNGLGIEIGYVLCRYLEVQKYEWSGIRQTQTLAGKAKRLLLQLSPHSWMTVKWEFTSNWKRFLTLQVLLIAFQIKDLNSFFLKAVLWIPSEHPLNIYRIALLFFIGIPSLRQIYIYMSDNRCKRLGSQAWVLTLIIVAEMLINIKFGRTLFQTRSAPIHVKIMWVGLIPCYVFVCVSILLKSKKNESPKQAKIE